MLASGTSIDFLISISSYFQLQLKLPLVTLGEVSWSGPSDHGTTALSSGWSRARLVKNFPARRTRFLLRKSFRIAPGPPCGETNLL